MRIPGTRPTAGEKVVSKGRKGEYWWDVRVWKTEGMERTPSPTVREASIQVKEQEKSRASTLSLQVAIKVKSAAFLCVCSAQEGQEGVPW